MWLNHFEIFDEIIYLCHLWVWTSKSPQNLNQTSGTTESSRALPEPDSNRCSVRNSSTKLFQDRDGLENLNGIEEQINKSSFFDHPKQVSLCGCCSILFFLVQLGLLLTIAICGLLEVLVITDSSPQSNMKKTVRDMLLQVKVACYRIGLE